MTHEPECQYGGTIDPAFRCNDCELARAAYQRGREDKEKEVLKRLLVMPAQQIKLESDLMWWIARGIRNDA